MYVPNQTKPEGLNVMGMQKRYVRPRLGSKQVAGCLGKKTQILDRDLGIGNVEVWWG